MTGRAVLAASALALLALACMPAGRVDGPAGPPVSGSGGAMTMRPGAGGAPAEPAQPAGPPPVRCAESVVGGRALVRLTAGEIGNTLRDVFPEAKDAFTLGLSDPLDSKDGFVNPGKLLVGEDSADKLLAAARSIADVLVGPAPGAAAGASLLAGKFPCAAAARDAACADEIIKRYGRRLFRRALTAAEQQRYLQLFTTTAKPDFNAGIKWALVALMQSPHTLYRRQIGQPMGGGVHRLTQTELASELAYTFTGTAPSEELLAKAERGQLGSREALVTEARTLLDSPAGRHNLGEFFRLWLGYDLVTANQRDRVPGFAGVRDKLAEETRVFVDRVVYGERGGIAQLLTAPFTTIDAALGTYYGMPGAGPAFGPVMRPKGQGIGLLAQGSILAERSQSLNSSPTKRGILVRQKLLCLEIPAQPAMVPDLPPPGAGWRTTRQRFEAVHAQGGCAACHRFMDPFGYPLEHYDEGGRYRATENGEPIDTSATVIGAGDEPLFKIMGGKEGQEELARALAARPDVAACAAETLSKYFFGVDRDCLAADARNEFVAGKIGFTELGARLAGAPHFSERRD